MKPLASLLSACLLTALSAPVDGTAGAWQLLVPAGKFQPRDGRGPYDAGGRAEMAAIVAATAAYRGATEMVVDYDHQSLFGVKDGVGGTARAAGWVKALDVRDDGIWGRIEWTAAAAAAIKAGEYRYLSPVPAVRPDGRVAAILSIALTNVPALDLEAVAASAVFPPLTTTEGKPMDKILKALGLAEGAGEDAAIAAINALSTSVAAIAVAAGLKPEAKAAEIQTAAVAALAERSRIAKAAGLAADATSDAIVAAMTAGAGAPDPTKWVPIAAVTELQGQVKALREERTGDKATEAVALAIKEGKLTPALEGWGLDLFKKDHAAFEAFVGKAPVLTGTQLVQPKIPSGVEGVALTAEQSTAAKVLGIDPKAYAETLKAERAA